MAKLSIAGLSKSYGANPVFDGLDLVAEDGEFVVLIGPSGCGKSTLLRLIAGLDAPDAGEIRIDSETVGDLAPSQRGVAMVFQSYALYPQMTVAQNIGFPLRMAGETGAEIDRRVREAAELLGLGDFLDRRPGQLSGGQRQRVAIGRAIVRQPRLFLFDEPLSNLDTGLRTAMRREFADLHQRFRTTTIYVTHDQSEAMALADRIVLMRDGRVVQAGTPREVYREPVDLFAAGFFGCPAINLLAGEVESVDAGCAAVRVAGASWKLPVGSRHALQPGAQVTLGVRPEDIGFQAGEHALALPGYVVALVEWLGSERHIVCSGPAGEIVLRTSTGDEVGTGQPLTLHADPAKVLTFDGNGVRIG